TRNSSDRNIQLPYQIAHYLAHDCDHSLPGAAGAGTGTRGDVDLDSFAAQQFLNAEDVVLVADGETAVHAVGAENYSDSLGALGGGGAHRLGDQGTLGNAAVREVVTADASFAETRVCGGASGGDDDRGETSLKQIVGVVEAGAENRRGVSGIFGGAEDDDGV